MGLFVEMKDYVYNLNYLGIDMAEELYSILTHYGIGTIADCTNKMPVIIHSFEVEALDKFATLSDLPMNKCHGYEDTTAEEWESFS